MDTATFNTFLVVMAVTALIVFIALHFINAGYGMLFDKKWRASLSNRIGWIVMEAPVFIAMIFLWIFATDEYRFDPIRITFLVLFQIHYFQRSFIFPFLIKGNSRTHARRLDLLYLTPRLLHCRMVLFSAIHHRSYYLLCGNVYQHSIRLHYTPPAQAR